MNKEQIYEYLKKRNIWFEVDTHKAVYNMADLLDVDISYPEGDAKNLFLCDDKKINYYLITVKGDKRVNLSKFRRDNGTRPLSFASSEELENIMGLIPGSVTPLGILNDKDKKVTVFIDSEFKPSDIIGVHPNDNTATLWLKSKDLIDIIKDNGNVVKVVDI